MTIKRNADQTLPASHIIEMIFLTPEGFDGGGIENILRVAMKGSEQEAGNPLIGIPAKIADGFFLVALNDTKAEIDANLTLLRRQSWIDVPVVYKSGRRALFTMEKGIPGEKVFDEALKAWAGGERGLDDRAWRWHGAMPRPVSLSLPALPSAFRVPAIPLPGRRASGAPCRARRWSSGRSAGLLLVEGRIGELVLQRRDRGRNRRHLLGQGFQREFLLVGELLRGRLRLRRFGGSRAGSPARPWPSLLRSSSLVPPRCASMSE